ncbi:MAG: SPOR domain-containing protein [Croceibacterium sp.]
MPFKLTTSAATALLLLAGAAAVPALADVKGGVDAWSRGDYTAAVSQWQGPAEAGDPDAMFNLAQAYRMGRGVAADTKRAETLYARAAAAGHLQAADTYGLMLFQDGRREAALPYVRDAARRGDPRSQYLLGIAHFNGDLLPKDWVRAYALVTLANAEGLPQAAQALAQMDQHIPLDQRQQAVAMAQTLRAEAEAARTVQLAAVDLAARQPRAERPSVQTAAAAPRMPRAGASVAMSPSVAAAREAVAEARRATGSESPADAGASFARPSTISRRPQLAAARPAPPPPAAAPARPEQTRVSLAPAATRAVPMVDATAPARTVPVASPTATGGPWRVQLGAFSVAANAQVLWQQVSGRAELAGKNRVVVASGGVTRLQAGGFASRGGAEAACRSLQKAGQPCLVPPR